MQSDMSVFLDFQHELAAHDIDLHPSELHGMLVGFICGAKSETGPSQRRALYSSWLDSQVPDDLAALLEAAYTSTLDNLDEYADFEFRLLVPDDEEPISVRANAIARWCGGFLSGLGESGRQIDTDQGDVKEVLTDLSRIAAITDEIPDGEENEEDLTQIEEFVRVSTLLIFAETRPTGTH